MNIFYVIALIALVVAVLAFFASWAVYPPLIVAVVAGALGFVFDRSGGRW